MNEILSKGLQLIIDLSNPSGLHVNDEDNAKIILKTLKKKGVDLDPKLIENWLNDTNLEPAPIKQIVAWSKSINTGGRVQLKNKAMALSEKEAWEQINN